VTVARTRVLTIGQDVGQAYLERATGIIAVFDNLEACQTDMVSSFAAATDIRLLLQIGRREFGAGDGSYFAVPARSKTQLDTKVRVLRASGDSPFLSPMRATARGSTSIDRWREDMRRLETEIELLRSEHKVHIVDRQHREPFLWRMFLFDDVAYVSAYLFQRDNDQKAHVYKITKHGDSSLFAVFDKYFEYLWSKSDPNNSAASIESWAQSN
jgi:hypothetical protein